MKNRFIIPLLFFVIILSSCKREHEEARETVLKGSTSIIVDETLLPIIQDQILVFESQYDAKITAVARSEKEAILAFSNDTANIVILPRKLSEQELKVFENKKITVEQTKFASDGIALITNSKSVDSLIEVKTIISYLKGDMNTNIKGLVFDNPNSSTTRFFMEMASIESLPENGVFSFNTNQEAIRFISENEGMIGVVGLNWLVEPDLENLEMLQNIKTLGVQGLNSENYVKPSQNNIAAGTYPLARDLYIINAQGFAGLGMGFGSFITGERGQRIILKSGLLPYKMPSRNIVIRTSSEKK